MSLVAAIQMNSGPDVARNLESAFDLVRSAADRGARLVVLPENFSYMADDEAVRYDTAVEWQARVADFLSSTAKACSVSLVGGTTLIPVPDLGQVRNTSLVYDENGACVESYDKMHLFDVDLGRGESYCESDYAVPGERLATVDSPVGCVGLSVCYDLRFPELYRALGARGAELFTVPSAFAVTTGRVHWHVLLKARAIENLAYVVAPAQVGQHPGGRMTYGHTLIIGPWGETLGERPDGSGVVLARVDRDELRRLRERFPSLKHRRLGD
jgi:predicted amidohydrolase